MTPILTYVESQMYYLDLAGAHNILDLVERRTAVLVRMEMSKHVANVVGMIAAMLSYLEAMFLEKRSVGLRINYEGLSHLPASDPSRNRRKQ